jgi:predicted regulator of Ras-like GTPase activity (Roadblock/LC7/MglB family)
MPGLPPLLSEDIEAFDQTLSSLLEQGEATAVLLIDQGGPILTQIGDTSLLDTTSLAALAAGAFAATQGVARILGETDFSSVYQQGRSLSVIVHRVDDNLLLLVIFKASLSAGMVKYHAAISSANLVHQVDKATARSPGESIDLVSMNIEDATQVFRRKDP